MDSFVGVENSYRFQVALSFSGSYRRHIRQIAEELAVNLGNERVLYDEWYRSELARPNLDIYLPELYLKQSRLLVFFFSKEYATSEWTGLEWRRGRELMKQKQDDRLMFFRFDKTPIPGFLLIDGFIDIKHLEEVSGQSPEETEQKLRSCYRSIATDILKRLDAIAPLPRIPIELVVRELKKTSATSIQERCGKIRVLSMEKGLELGSVYTDVLILEKRTSNQRKTQNELLLEAKWDDFERIGLSSSMQMRIEGSELLKDSQRVIVYGKPGAGKTTFLKHLATQCSKDVFRPDLVPVFITLRDYSDVPDRMSISSYIEEQFAGNSGLQAVLNHGLCLVLLDGLDEVKQRDFARVRRAVEEFIQKFPLCIVVITCRIAAREYAFGTFTEVEMADFDSDQIETFSSRWFAAYAQPAKSAQFMAKLQDKPEIMELASNPLMLTLLCLVFQDSGDFGGTRARLYEEGIEILRRKWDSQRDIQRDFPSDITGETLMPLLTEVAYSRFFSGEYFFDQGSLEEQVSKFMRERWSGKDASKIDPFEILKSIEANIGLLVTRAVNVYSFSHLTFQEFLTAQRVSKNPQLLGEIGPHIGQGRWREVWILLSSMFAADYILLEIKSAIDTLVKDSPLIQQMLLNATKRSKGSLMQKAASRAFYCGLDFLAANLITILRKTKQEVPPRVLEGDLRAMIDDAQSIAKKLQFESNTETDFDEALLSLMLRSRIVAFARDQRGGHSNDAGLSEALHEVFDLAKDRLPKLAKKLPFYLQQLEADHLHNQLEERYLWAESLEETVAYYRNNGDARNFPLKERTLLIQYFRANQLIFDCMDAASALTTETQQYIETSMFLPHNEIPKPMVSPRLRALRG